MVATMSIRVSGLEKVANRYNPNVVQVPFRRFFVRSATTVHKGVSRRTRKFSGEARNSIKIQFDTAVVIRWARVFSDLFRMRFLEFGTKPHGFPVTEQFRAYARRKKRDPFVLMQAIAARGTKGRHMFRKTARGTRRIIFGYSRDARNEIAANLNRR